MKKISLTLLVCLFIISGWSQNNLATFIFEGKQLNVYPYRAKTNNSSTDNMFLKIQENIDIPYCPIPLPDGDYVVFYPKDCHYDKYYTPYYLKGDTDNIAIVFSIKAGKREGQARWFTEEYKGKRCYQSGNYIANEKDGTWNYRDGSEVKTYQYKNGLLDGEVVSIDKSSHQTKIYHFSKGQLHGKYLIKNTKTKDIIEFEFNNGALYGNYHQVIHNCVADQLVGLSLDMVRFSSRYGLHEVLYKEIEVNGQFHNNLKYGAWDVKTDTRIIQIVYDTVITNNGFDNDGSATGTESVPTVRPYHEYYGEESMSGEPFTSRIIRIQKLKNEDDYYYVKSNPINAFLENGCGSYKEYDKKGNLINANSFNDQSLKYPFILKDLKGNTIAKFDSGANNLYVFELNSSQGFSKTTFLKTDTGLSFLEEHSHSFSKSFSSDEWERSLAYFKYHNLTGLKTITYDSSIYKDNKYASTYTHCIDVGTGFKFTRSYSDNSIYETVWSIDTLRQQVFTTYKRIYGELTIVDTVYFEIGTVRNIFTNPNYSYSYDLTPLRNYLGVVPDSLQFCFIWKGERFNGDIYFKVIDKPLKKNMQVAKEVQNTRAFNFGNRKELFVYIEKSALSSIFRITKQQIPITNFNINVKEGLLSGDLNIIAVYNKKCAPVILYKARYKNNLKDGVEEDADFKVYRKKVPNGIVRTIAAPYYYLAHKQARWEISSVKQNHIEYQYYRDGKMDGTSVKKTNQGQVEYILNYSKGMLDGPCMKLSENETPLLKLNFKNDTLNGIYECFNINYELTDITNFKNGLPHGKYFKYEYRNQSDNESSNSLSTNVNFCKERKINTIELEFNNGYLVNTGKYYHCDGILKAQVTYDSKDSIRIINFKRNNKKYTYFDLSNSYEPATEDNHTRYVRTTLEIQPRSSLFYSSIYFGFYPNLPGNYMYFYKSGIRSQEGKVGKDGLKTGWWKFWNENGILMKEILYEKGTIANPLNPKDSIHYTGKIIGYHPNGKFMMDGYVLDENFKYECVQDEEMAYQDVFYSRFVDENGIETFKGYSGMVRDYHINGNKREEGMMLNGLRNGLWKTYESNGNLGSIGYYKNGKKDGSWLYGDLSGIGFVDNQCFDFVIDISKIKGNLSEDHLQFEETIYQDGKILKNTVQNVDIE